MKNNLPIFPLGLVALPGSIQSLQIFEPRYVNMIKSCMSENHGFVIVLQNNEIKDFEISKKGTYVEIKASVDENGTLFAREIEIEDGDEQNNADVEGIISDLLDNGEIVVEGIAIVLNEMTEFENGNISRIEVGAYVEVEGQFNEQQKLVARKIEFSDSDESEIEGRIGAVLSETQFTLGDLVIEHNQYTAFKYGSASDISAGVEVEVDGFVNDEGIFIAEKIEFQED